MMDTPPLCSGPMEVLWNTHFPGETGTDPRGDRLPWSSAPRSSPAHERPWRELHGSVLAGAPQNAATGPAHPGLPEGQGPSLSDHHPMSRASGHLCARLPVTGR